MDMFNSYLTNYRMVYSSHIPLNHYKIPSNHAKKQSNHLKIPRDHFDPTTNPLPAVAALGGSPGSPHPQEPAATAVAPGPTVQRSNPLVVEAWDLATLW